MSVERTHSGAYTQASGCTRTRRNALQRRVTLYARVAHAIVTRTVQQHSHSKQQNKSKKRSSQFHAYNEAEHHTIILMATTML